MEIQSSTPAESTIGTNRVFVLRCAVYLYTCQFVRVPTWSRSRWICRGVRPAKCWFPSRLSKVSKKPRVVPARLNVLAPPESRPPPCNGLLEWIPRKARSCSVWRTETDRLASNNFGFAAMHGLMDFWRVMKLSSSDDDSLEPSQIASSFGPSGKFCSSLVCLVAGLQKTSTGSTISPLQADTALSMPGKRMGEEARSQTIERLGRLFQSSSRRLVVFVPRLQVARGVDYRLSCLDRTPRHLGSSTFVSRLSVDCRCRHFYSRCTDNL